MQSIKNAIE